MAQTQAHTVARHTVLRTTTTTATAMMTANIIHQNHTTWIKNGFQFGSVEVVCCVFFCVLKKFVIHFVLERARAHTRTLFLWCTHNSLLLTITYSRFVFFLLAITPFRLLSFFSFCLLDLLESHCVNTTWMCVFNAIKCKFDFYFIWSAVTSFSRQTNDKLRRSDTKITLFFNYTTITRANFYGFDVGNKLMDEQQQR